MSNPAQLLLISDPKLFMAVVHEQDPAKRVHSLHTLDDLMACEALRHGIFNDWAALPSLRQFYNEIFLQAPVDRRREIYRHVAMIVPQIGGWSAGAMTPFMLLDPDMAIVSTATVDYARLGSLLNDDPMTRPKDAISMIEKGIPKNPAAVIGGLLVLGDLRVCRLLVPLRASLMSIRCKRSRNAFPGSLPSASWNSISTGWTSSLIGASTRASLYSVTSPPDCTVWPMRAPFRSSWTGSARFLFLEMRGGQAGGKSIRKSLRPRSQAGSLIWKQGKLHQRSYRTRSGQSD